MPVTVIRLTRTRNAAGDLVVRLGAGLLDEYLEFLAGRRRPNTVLAVAYDLKVFFTAVGKPPRRVCPVDVLAFMTTQRTGGQGRLQVAGGGAGGVSARTLRRRLSSVSGLYGFLLARGDVTANPVPGAADAAEAAAARSGGPAGPGAPDAAADPQPGRVRRADCGPVHAPGPGDGAGRAGRRPGGAGRRLCGRAVRGRVRGADARPDDQPHPRRAAGATWVA